MLWRVLCIALVFHVADVPSTFAEEADTKAVQSAKSAEELHTVAKGPIKVELELDGVVEAERMWPVEVKLKQWQTQSLKVVEPVEQGRVVQAGDTLLTFDTEEIDRVVRDAELTTEGAKAVLDGARHEVALTELSVAMDTDAAERAFARAQHDLEYFTKVSRPISEKMSAERVKSSGFQVEYAMEELKQLEKMYQEDELTEETEEIILIRQKRAVEFSRINHEQVLENHNQLIQVTLPRRQEDLEIGVAKAKLELDRARATLPLKLVQTQQALQRAEHGYTDAAKRLEELRAERAALAVKAPADGVVYYGRTERGRWLDTSSVALSMKPQGTLRPNTPFITIVSPQPVMIRADVTEAQAAKLQPQLNGWVIPTADPHTPLPAVVRSVGKLPIGPNQFDLVVDVADGSRAGTLRPGATCNLKFTPYENPDALKLPLAAVKSDRPGEHHVFVKTEQGPQRREVRLGQRTATEAEVLEGLKEGEQVFAKGEPAK